MNPLSTVEANLLVAAGLPDASVGVAPAWRVPVGLLEMLDGRRVVVVRPPGGGDCLVAGDAGLPEFLAVGWVDTCGCAAAPVKVLTAHERNGQVTYEESWRWGCDRCRPGVECGGADKEILV